MVFKSNNYLLQDFIYLKITSLYLPELQIFENPYKLTVTVTGKLNKWPISTCCIAAIRGSAQLDYKHGYNCLYINPTNLKVR